MLIVLLICLQGVQYEAAIQQFPLSLLTAVACFFHSAALSKFTEKLGREMMIIILIIHLLIIIIIIIASFLQNQASIIPRKKAAAAQHLN